MMKLVQEKKIIYRLVLLSVITTPLFAILGGTPFLRFDFQELRDFLPGIYFTAIITIMFWLINISLLLLAEKYKALKNILLRAFISIAFGLAVAAAGFNLYTPNDFPKPVRYGTNNSEFSGIGEGAGMHNDYYPEPPPDSVVRFFDKGGLRMNKPSFFFFPMALRPLTINLIILSLCELVFLYFRKQNVEHENIYLKQMNLEAKNNQLNMQLHPHFLFNSLNTLRLLLKKDTAKAEDYLLKLSDLLRFSTTAALQNVVDVADELKLCMAYLEMQKVRFGDMLHFVVMNKRIYYAKGKLPVYSLQLLAENAIKHNAFTNEEPLTIFIEFEEESQTITVRNKVQPKRTAEPTTMSGLSNLNKRYQLLNKESIQITEVNNEFAVTINILPVT